MAKKSLREIAERALAPCAEEHAFRFASGETARELKEFRARLFNADPGVVEHHRHHYHYWVRDVCGDETLAARLEAIGADDHLTGRLLSRKLFSTVGTRVSALEKSLRPAPRRRAGANRGQPKEKSAYRPKTKPKAKATAGTRKKTKKSAPKSAPRKKKPVKARARR